MGHSFDRKLFFAKVTPWVKQQMRRGYWVILWICLLPVHTKAQEKPNIIVVMADDIGLGDIGFYHVQRTGKEAIVPTPNIDQLIRTGMRFSDAHSPASLCAPTRFSMMTGNFSYHNPRPWGVWSPVVDAGIYPKFTTGAHIAKQGGYTTAFFGKWGLGGLWEGWPEDFVTTQGGAQQLGFDYSLVLPQGIQNKPYVFYENGRWMKLKRDSKLVHIPFAQTKYEEDNRNRNRDGIGDSHWDPAVAGPILAKKAVAYIREQAKRNRPFYLYYCSQAVHVPHTPTAKLNRTKIAGTTLGKHGDMIKELDAQVGMLVKALKKKGLYKNTLFVFTSDNGGLKRDKALLGTGHDSSNGLTGSKGSIYEGGHRVPFIAVWPGNIKENVRSDVTIVGHDLVATIAALADVPLDTHKILDSANLLPILTENSAHPVHKFLLHQSQAPGGPFYALREGDWKLVLKAQSRRNFENIRAVGLYHLTEGATEFPKDNLIKEPSHAERIKKMHQTYLGLRRKPRATVF